MHLKPRPVGRDAKRAQVSPFRLIGLRGERLLFYEIEGGAKNAARRAREK